MNPQQTASMVLKSLPVLLLVGCVNVDTPKAHVGEKIDIESDKVTLEVAPKVAPHKEFSPKELYSALSLEGQLDYLAFKEAFRVAKHSQYSNGKFAVIDFTKHSAEKRLFLFDLAKGKLLSHTYVSHGVLSGGAYAKEFSNRKGSNMSSLGHILGAETYIGRNGYSLRLDGMTVGLNDNLRSRYISLHPSSYATQEHIQVNKMLGRSDGCFAVPPSESKMLIDSLANGGIIYAYWK